ncbi:MAG: hypothetical protein HY000_31255 [Planctomycetes bacterium]|nr:hypothetical protein [Planctomycetota bacterium]
MIQVLRRNLFQTLKMIIYGRWPERSDIEAGYTILLAIPADMPFLLQFALLGLRHLQMPNCRQILVISDGAASDHTLRMLVTAHGDERVQYVPLALIDKVLINLPRSDGSANYRHFTQILRGVLAATTEAIYLHDADAFWLEQGGIESQYREFCERGMYTLGVTPRIDAMFKDRGLDMPGTWELMFSSSWARTRPPVEMKCGWYPLPDGEWRWFDTMLFGQYMDYASGRVGVMANPPKFVHFYGTIVQYRCWQRAGHSRSWEDELFCLLLLSVLAEAIAGTRCEIPLPRPHELARGLRDPAAPITYLAKTAPKRYASFRRGIENLCSSPAFGNDVASRIRTLVAPFDKHFSFA